MGAPPGRLRVSLMAVRRLESGMSTTWASAAVQRIRRRTSRMMCLIMGVLPNAVLVCPSELLCKKRGEFSRENGEKQ